MKDKSRNSVGTRLSTPIKAYLPHRPSKSASVLLAALVLSLGTARNADATLIILSPDDTRPSVLMPTPLSDSNVDLAKVLRQEIAGPSFTLKATFTYAKTYDAFIQAGKELGKKLETRNAAIDSFANAIKMAPDRARKEIFALDDGIKPLWLQALNKAGMQNMTNISTEPEKKHSILPWLIGGAAVLAAAVYFLTKKKSSTSTTPAETVATLHGSVRGLIKGGNITDGTVTLSGTTYSSPIAADGTYSITNIKNPGVGNYKRIKLSSSQAITRETNITIKEGDNLFNTDMIENDNISGFEFNDYLLSNWHGGKMDSAKEYKVYFYDRSIFDTVDGNNIIGTTSPTFTQIITPLIRTTLQENLPALSKGGYKYNGLLLESEGAIGPGIPKTIGIDGWLVIYWVQNQNSALTTACYLDSDYRVKSGRMSIRFYPSWPQTIPYSATSGPINQDICQWAGFNDLIKKWNYSIFDDSSSGFMVAERPSNFDLNYTSVIKHARLTKHDRDPPPEGIPDYDDPTGVAVNMPGNALLNAQSRSDLISSAGTALHGNGMPVQRIFGLMNPGKIEAGSKDLMLGADPTNGSVYVGLGGKSGGIRTALNLANGFGNLESITTATFNKGGFAGNAAMRRASGVEVYDADVSTNIGGIAVGVVDAFDARNNANLLSVRLGTGGSDGRKNDFTGQRYVLNYRMAQSNSTKAQFVDAQAVFGKILVNGSYGNINANNQQMTEYSLGAAAQLGAVVLTTSYRGVNSAINPYQQYSVGGNGSIGKVYFSGSYSRVSMNSFRQDLANAGVSAPIGPGNLNLGFFSAPGIRDTRVSYSIFVGL